LGQGFFHLAKISGLVFLLRMLLMLALRRFHEIVSATFIPETFFEAIHKQLGADQKFVVFFVQFIDVFSAVESPIHDQMNLFQVQKGYICQHVPDSFDIGNVSR
jgi:hypothetical protein